MSRQSGSTASVAVAVTVTATATAAKSMTDIVDGVPHVNFRDAGNRSRDHYKSSMPPWRFRIRQLLLPLVRWETPQLAWIQSSLRCKFLDDYFAFTANLGTHTFFVIMLPIPFWFGYCQVGRNLVYVLAAGVYVTGVTKDFFCLPRPLSPPLHRITMSGSAALEYGFPSTHSCNAVSAALILYYTAVNNADGMSSWTLLAIKFGLWVYVLSIILGRIYCGMHGFLDVVAGTVLGAVLFLARWWYGSGLDKVIAQPSWIVPVTITPIILLLVRVHAEPVDPCPCFEDSVAFAGVVLGVDLALWWYCSSSSAVACAAYDFATVGVIRSLLRVVIGVLAIFVWRATLKRTLHAILPPIYRFIEQIGLSMPREYFLKASEYKDVPSSIPDSTLVNAAEIPSLIQTITARKRADSVGPQSTADVYETIAYRQERQRRKSLDLQRSPKSTANHKQETNETYNDKKLDLNKLQQQQQQQDRDEDEDQEDGLTEEQLFLQFKPPRVQYDVEVITKLIVYAGIGFIGAGFCGPIFDVFGLGN
ncbi:PAP2 superfamily-domain-containing protein [Lipomyces japonicus]|uniref:PAP2 superfamily-domain-containing protein n=1 Tax=Lipomyces japonicus TaxID=56871 RepID=UPI0034CFC7AE